MTWHSLYHASDQLETTPWRINNVTFGESSRMPQKQTKTSQSDYETVFLPCPVGHFQNYHWASWLSMYGCRDVGRRASDPIPADEAQSTPNPEFYC